MNILDAVYRRLVGTISAAEHAWTPVAGRLVNIPWLRAFSIVLTGAYDEERLVGSPDRWRYMSPEGQCALCGRWRGECRGHAKDTDMKKVRWFNVLTGDDYHQVDKLHGDVWTLFVAGEKKPDDAWGFLDEDGNHIDHREFIAARAADVVASSRQPDDEMPGWEDAIESVLRAHGLAEFEGHP